MSPLWNTPQNLFIRCWRGWRSYSLTLIWHCSVAQSTNSLNFWAGLCTAKAAMLHWCWRKTSRQRRGDKGTCGGRSVSMREQSAPSWKLRWSTFRWNSGYPLERGYQQVLLYTFMFHKILLLFLYNILKFTNLFNSFNWFIFLLAFLWLHLESFFF